MAAALPALPHARARTHARTHLGGGGGGGGGGGVDSDLVHPPNKLTADYQNGKYI